MPASIVYEDEDVIAFKDIHPAAPTHMLFVPKKHVGRLDDLSPDQTQIINNIYSSILSFVNLHGLKESGFKVQVNVGKGGGQVVFHLHFHLLSNKKLEL